MAKAEKIYDIAEKLGYEGDTGGNTSDAINACADALGFVGPHARRITDALSDLKTVVGGGGGGGSLGALAPIEMHGVTPEVGGSPNFWGGGISAVGVGDSIAATALQSSAGSALVARGAKLYSWAGEGDVTTSYEIAAYAITYGDEFKFATVRSIAGVSAGLSYVDLEGTGESATYAWFAVPDALVLNEDETLAIAITAV